MTSFQSIAHLYIGCDVRIFDKAHGIWSKPRKLTPLVLYEFDKAEYLNFSVNIKAQLILRPLSDMTEEEKELFGFAGEGKVIEIDVLKVENFVPMLSRSFDLFGLIESGQAVDKTKIKP